MTDVQATALVTPLLMIAVWWAVGSALAPVRRAGREVGSRQPDDLRAVPEEGLPSEVRPLVHELNLLFGRVRSD